MTRDEQPWKKIDRKWVFGQSTSATEVKETHHKSAQTKELQDVHQASDQEERLHNAQTRQAQAEEMEDDEVDINQDYDLTKSPWDPIDNYLGSEQEATPVVQSQPMLHDPLLRYVTKTKYLIDLVPTKEVTISENLATEASPEQSSSSTSSLSETEDGDEDAVLNKADKEYLEQMEVDYKGTEGTQEDIGGVPEVYQPIPYLDEDWLFSGEAMDASPRTESTLLLDTAKPAEEIVPPAPRDTTGAASVLANPDILTAEEFLGLPKLEAAGEEEDREEVLASFDAMSHWTPELPTPKENLPLERTDHSPTKRNKRSRKGGKSGKH